MSDEPYLIDLGNNYKVSFRRGRDGVISLEVHTKLDSITKEAYVRIMMAVLHYMGAEGFFDGWLPKELAIYNKFGQLIPVQNLS
jgi:hypothetical protein